MILVLSKVDDELFADFWDNSNTSRTEAIELINEPDMGPLLTDWEEFRAVRCGCIAFEVSGTYGLDLALKEDVSE